MNKKGITRTDWSGCKPGEKMGNGILKTGVFKNMTKDEIGQGLAEIYHYNCHKCGQGNLSRDEVSARDHKYICLKCLHARESSRVDRRHR